MAKDPSGPSVAFGFVSDSEIWGNCSHSIAFCILAELQLNSGEGEMGLMAQGMHQSGLGNTAQVCLEHLSLSSQLNSSVLPKIPSAIHPLKGD